MACTAACKDFCSSSLVIQPLGLSFCFDPTSACVSPSGLCPLPRQEGVKAAAAWGTLRLGCARVACSDGDWQAVVTKCGSLLWWESLQVLAEAGAGMWWWWRPHPLHASQPWHLTFQAEHTFSSGISSRASSPSCPLCGIHAANSVLLPRSVLPTPCFSTQPLPTSADSRPRQGCPGLFPRKVLGWVALRPPQPLQVEETLV